MRLDCHENSRKVWKMLLMLENPQVEKAQDHTKIFSTHDDSFYNQHKSVVGAPFFLQSQSHRKEAMVPHLCFILSLTLLFIIEIQQIVADKDELCETLPSEIHIIKEEFDELGRLQRTCNGEISVNKCEGACNSQVQPSVITPTGFLKECYCCRESFLRERIITLTHCYDPDGMRLTRDDNKSMDIKLKEPNDCKCSKCGDFSR